MGEEGLTGSDGMDGWNDGVEASVRDRWHGGDDRVSCPRVVERGLDEGGRRLCFCRRDGRGRVVGDCPVGDTCVVGRDRTGKRIPGSCARVRVGSSRSSA